MGDCKLIHLTSATLLSVVSEALQLLDVEVRQCFTCRSYGLCMAAGPTESKSRWLWASLNFPPVLSCLRCLPIQHVCLPIRCNLCRCYHSLSGLPKGTVKETRGPPVLIVVGSILNWERGKHAVLDITVTSPLIPSILTAASLSDGAAGGGVGSQEAGNK